MHPLIDKFQSKAYCMFSVLYKIDLHNNLHPRGKKGEGKKKKERKREQHIFFLSFLCYTVSRNRIFSINLYKNDNV